MIIAADTSALAKLLLEEPESANVRSFLAERSDRGDEIAISTVAVTELRRLGVRLGIGEDWIDPVVSPFRVVRLTEGMLQLAGRLPHRNLGTLDAIHIATALSIEAEMIITFDARQAEAARHEGLQVAPAAVTGMHVRSAYIDG